jgi:3-phosphoshikimate 1-carboxyvinyltransferase
LSAERFEPSGPLRGSLRPPADKSISHRAAIIAAMSSGRSRVGNFLDAADTRSTLAAVEALGATVEELRRDGGGLSLRITGAGLRGAADAEIDVGNAGTLLRILPGWLAGQERGAWTLDGDESIRRRPVDRVAEPLRAMGAQVECRDDRLPPLRVTGAALRGIRYELPVASAQVKSCVLLAGLLADGETTVAEPAPTRDHTERMLETAGAELGVRGNGISVRRATALELGDVEVPGDFSSAAFFLIAALIVDGSELAVDGVGLNPTRTGLLTILERMGAVVEAEVGARTGGEPLGRIEVRPAPLQAVEIAGEEIPRAIDELPLVALAACFAEGQTVIRDAGELRHKESDRIAAVAAALNAIGAEVRPTDDGLVISGTGGLRGGAIDSRGDHRLAMMGAIAGLASREGVTVQGMEAAAVSYPGLERDLAGLLA